MNDTREIKAFYEDTLLVKLEELTDSIKKDGFDEHRISLDMLADDLKRYEAIGHAVRAWHTESK